MQRPYLTPPSPRSKPPAVLPRSLPACPPDLVSPPPAGGGGGGGDKVREGCPPRVPDASGPLPDLLPIPADATANLWFSTETFDSRSCDVKESSGRLSAGTHRLLRFTATIANNGTADLFLGDVKKCHVNMGDDLFYWSTCHGKWRTTLLLWDAVSLARCAHYSRRLAYACGRVASIDASCLPVPIAPSTQPPRSTRCWQPSTCHTLPIQYMTMLRIHPPAVLAAAQRRHPLRLCPAAAATAAACCCCRSLLLLR